LFLALVSGLLFGIVPLGQVMRANPYDIVKAGSSSDWFGRRVTIRDVLLVTQIAICAMLITASLVAVRGLMRSLHTNYGFEPQNTLLFTTNLTIAGYTEEGVLPMQKRMTDAMATIPGAEHVGLVNDYPPLVYASAHRTPIFKDETMDLTPSNAALTPYRYVVSPGYFEAAATSLLAGRNFSWNDDKKAPRVGVANAEFARRMFGDASHAVGRYFRIQDGTRIQVVGVVEDGKYLSLTEDQQPAIFLTSLQSPSSGAYVIVRSRRDVQQLAAAMRNKLREVDSGLPAEITTWDSLLGVALFPSRMAAVTLGVLGVMGAILSITGIFGMSAYSVNKRRKELGLRIALGAQRSQILGAALGRAIKLLTVGSVAGLLLGIMASRVLSAIVYQATSRDPLVLIGVAVAMSLLGLLATWIPAQRALAVNPLILLREE
jgi:predicted permease